MSTITPPAPASECPKCRAGPGQFCTNISAAGWGQPLKGNRSHAERTGAPIRRHKTQDFALPLLDSALAVRCRVCGIPEGQPCRRATAPGYGLAGEGSGPLLGHSHASRRLDAMGSSGEESPVDYQTGRPVETVPEL